jgi:hypothetical protein
LIDAGWRCGVGSSEGTENDEIERSGGWLTERGRGWIERGGGWLTERFACGGGWLIGLSGSCGVESDEGTVSSSIHGIHEVGFSSWRVLNRALATSTPMNTHTPSSRKKPRSASREDAVILKFSSVHPSKSI